MAEILRYVDPNADAGGDGTTNGLTGANCAYVSLNAWEAATQQDLTDGGGDTARVVCSSDDAGSTHAADTTAVTIDGWTTSATCYITIEAASSHGGKWDDTIYRITGQNYNDTIKIIERYVNLSGLQIRSPAAMDPGNAAINLYTTSDGAVISNNIIRNGQTSRTGCYGVNIHWNNSGTYYFYNNVVYDFIGSGSVGVVLGEDAGITSYLYNCTIVNCATGATVRVTTTAVNTYIGNCTTEYSGTIGTRTTCAHSSATSYSGSTASVAYTTDNFINVTAGSEDLHLAAGSALINQGTDLSGTFTDDIDGETRPTGAGTWDIGADEYVAAGGGPVIPVFMHHYLHNMGR